LLVWPLGQLGLRRHVEHTRLVEAVQLTSMYFLPSTHSLAHARQLDQPVPLAYLPLSQETQDVEPVVRLERVPTGHLSHCTDPGEAEKLPGPQATHAEAPEKFAYVPAGHCTQALSPVTPAYVPGAHAEQLLGLATSAVAYPKGHLVQLVLLMTENVPGWQLLQ
jgi:hypothetical protein